MTGLFRSIVDAALEADEADFRPCHGCEQEEFGSISALLHTSKYDAVRWIQLGRRAEVLPNQHLGLDRNTYSASAFASEWTSSTLAASRCSSVMPNCSPNRSSIPRTRAKASRP